MSESDKILDQNLTEKAPEQSMLMAQLLFAEKPKQADPEKLQAALEKLVGKVNNISDKLEMPMFSVEKFTAEFKDTPNPIPVLADYIGPHDFSAELDDLTRSQLWDMRDGAEIMQQCKYSVDVFGMLASALHYKQQAELFLAQIEAALECYAGCAAIYVPHSGKLISPEAFYNAKKYDLSQRFILAAVNARFFNIDGTDDKVVDTLGFYAFGAADVQVHFHGMDPNHIVEYVYNIADYQFNSEFAVVSGDTIDGMDLNGQIQMDIQWRTQYEDSLIQPVRTVLDINAGEFAAGSRV